MRKTKALNIVQLLYVPSAQTCVTIPAPIQLLPQANWSTLIVRLRKWQFFSGGGLGRAWRRLGGDALAAIADAMPFVLVPFALGQGEGLEVGEMRARPGTGMCGNPYDQHMQ